MELPAPLKLSEIREKLGTLGHLLQEREFLACQSLPGGVPRGVISEITGTARTEWVLSCLLENPSLVTFWAETKLTLLPTAVHQRGVALSQILLAETGDKLFQTLRKALRCKLFDCVVLPGVIEETKMLKALQLFARESNSIVFFLSKNPKTAWAIPFQIRADWQPDAKSFHVEVLKSKFLHPEKGPEQISEQL